MLGHIGDKLTAEIVHLIFNHIVHKTNLTTPNDGTGRYKKMDQVQRNMYSMSVDQGESRIEYKLCEYLCQSDDPFAHIMVVAKRHIKKNTKLKELSAQLFPFAEKYVVKGVNDFSMIYSQLHKQQCLLLGPLAFVNHSCTPNCKFNKKI
ncbi:histone-lysine N-methyltransferase set9-like [Acyrthosiphon pisum]|uniref:SET domain-containing protein n=1 Tax=Acyrthosiphon pisum TaxID=7029 RepID=A0A8R2H3Q7_ACYPI|nr:histone-lysine N-methyltransferase set9-like [Acyrthosiphon pisum]|eukprot:XP_016658293.1 PREDICTED: histone-lysine N-methyltransferase set9-like [Acyrthosiphon pisum]